MEEGTGGIGGFTSPIEEYLHWARVAASKAYAEGIEPEDAVRKYVPTPLQKEVLPTAIVTFNTAVGINHGDAPDLRLVAPVVVVKNAGKVVTKTSTKSVPRPQPKPSIGGCNCFTEDTKVLTDDGEKKIKDIQVGDKVLSKDEE
ncbi:Hint domain-containing protein [Brevibacillus reuszeri]|uniref:Hint domain-containing protein n=1 Tax=Brevibacillus reuszeri TaxID=54915 RepID=UPI003672685F